MAYAGKSIKQLITNRGPAATLSAVWGCNMTAGTRSDTGHPTVAGKMTGPQYAEESE